MVLQNTIDNLRERPHHERHRVAQTISIIVVIILLIGWAFFFFRSTSPVDMQSITETYSKTLEAAAPMPPADPTGWVSVAPTSNESQTAGAAGGIQIIEEGTTTTSTATTDTDQDLIY